MSTLATPEAASVEKALAQALTHGALPGENEGFDGAAASRAAAFLASAGHRRANGKPAIVIDTTHEGSGEDGASERLMRIGIVNDDMPFLVDSIANGLAAENIVIHRLIHPVLSVERDADGALCEILPPDEPGARRESFIYIEADRVDAKQRHTLEQIGRAHV